MQAWYVGYAARFNVNGSLHPHLRLKLEHSARVADDARDVALDLNWSEEDVQTARVLGLLHDVGRFPQFADFGTFNDRDSINHGERGVEVLLSEDALAQCDAIDQARILDGVRYHNAGSLPSEIEDDSLRFVKLIRDADKLDVYYVVHNAIVDGQLNKDGNFMERLDLEAGPGPEILECLRQRRAVPNAMVRSLADFLLWQVGWVFDINYSATMQKLRDRQLLEKLRSHLPEGAEVDEAMALATNFRDKALDKRVSQ